MSLTGAHVSMFRSALDPKPVKSESIEAVLDGIGDGRWKKTIARLRYILAEDAEKYRAEKKNLPAVTFSGEFSTRANGALVKHSGYICLDLDGLEDDERLDAAQKKIIADPYSAWCFVSPSHAGLKIGVKIPEAKTADEHRLLFEAVERYYRKDLGLTLDHAGKDVARLCFVSYDPDIFVRMTAEPFPVEIESERAFRAATPRAREEKQVSVIEAFNRRHTIEEMLKRHGYAPRGRRYIRPGGSTPSVQVSDGKSFHHSSNDPLHGPHLIDPFDVFLAYEHGGSLTDAVRAAADLLGMRGAGVKKNSGGNGDDPAGSGAPPPEEGGERRAGRGYDGEYNYTDLGNALRLVETYGDVIRYNQEPFRKWLWWNGKHWQFDRTNKIYEYIDRVIRDMYREVETLESGERRKRLASWALQLEGMKRQNAMVSKSETMQRIAVSAEDLDSNPWLLNVANGTLDLAAGDVTFREHRQEDYLTRAIEAEYDPEARCPEWEKFLGEIFEHDAELIQFVQRAVGYSLTGDISEQCLFFAYGTGANGKSVFFNTLEMLFGEYFYRAPSEMILQQKNTQIPADVANLKGKRFVVSSELEENRRLAEARVKSLTGSDTIEARKLYGDWFSFQPTHKLWMFGNHKPVISGGDEGIWRRVRVIPFTVYIPEDARTPMRDMLDTFRGEMPGILNWALEGYQRYREAGFPLPKAMIDAGNQYRDEMDQVGQFIKECCVVNRNIESNGKEIWQAYHGWCDDQGEHSMGGRRFYAKLRERGLEVRAGTGNRTEIIGLGLLDRVN